MCLPFETGNNFIIPRGSNREMSAVNHLVGKVTISNVMEEGEVYREIASVFEDSFVLDEINNFK